MVMLMNDKVFGVRCFYSVLSKEMRRLEAGFLGPSLPVLKWPPLSGICASLIRTEKEEEFLRGGINGE
jgi:hypothetical protein